MPNAEPMHETLAQETMPLHTPGPWALAPDPRQNAVYAGRMRICDIRGWGHLTGAGAMDLPFEEAAQIQDANARLIAAAPVLKKSVEALRHLVLCMATGPGWTPELVIEIVTSAEAALAQAGVTVPAGQWDFLTARRDSARTE